MQGNREVVQRALDALRKSRLSVNLYLLWLAVCVGAFVLVCVWLFIDAGKGTK